MLKHIKEVNFFDLVLGKGIESLSETSGDNGNLSLIYISEWIRVWIGLIRHKTHYSYSSKLFSYIFKISKNKVISSINTIS